jgi:putative hydrolase of the HAD superfamily
LGGDTSIQVASHVLFDFFGTLVEYSASRTEQGYQKSFSLLRGAGVELDYQEFLSLWSEVFAQFDAAAEQDHREFSMIEVASAFLGRAVGTAPAALIRDFVRTYLSEWNKGVCYPDGVPELLERLNRRFVLAVVTNTHDADLVPDHLGRMGIARFFSQVITSVEYGKRKPAPEIFHHALRQLQVSPQRCVYVGDSYDDDYRGSQRAGIQPFLIDPLSKAPIPHSARLHSIFALEYHLSAAI